MVDANVAAEIHYDGGWYCFIRSIRRRKTSRYVWLSISGPLTIRICPLIMYYFAVADGLKGFPGVGSTVVGDDIL